MRRTWFAPFADCLLLGVFLLLASLPVVTAYPALVAGCTVLREQAHGGAGVTPRHFLAAMYRVLRSGHSVWLAPTGALALLWLDALALDAHGAGAGVAFAVATVALAALGLRCAAAWREGLRWRTVLAAAFRAVPGQPLAPVLLAGSTAAAAVLLTMSPVLLLIVLGPLAFAATAADAWRPLHPRTH
ncbi:hypothetical protein [Streptomyces sp. RTd22]|uniref:hypothetical protein n=1 Tax=Streptomyces sp. RTd22 TaxID=1841249 RepID=UPI0009A099B3|nr:hypothetical protein [Streptomyces sp. RTd22]